MITEETKCKILQVFGYTPQDLGCANADTAIGEIFEQDSFRCKVIGNIYENPELIKY